MQSKADRWVKMCLRKKKLSQGYADSIIEKAEIPLKKYYCPHCFNWHIAKQDKQSKVNNPITNKL